MWRVWLMWGRVGRRAALDTQGRGSRAPGQTRLPIRSLFPRGGLALGDGAPGTEGAQGDEKRRDKGDQTHGFICVRVRVRVRFRVRVRVRVRVRPIALPMRPLSSSSRGGVGGGEEGGGEGGSAGGAEGGEGGEGGGGEGGGGEGLGGGGDGGGGEGGAGGAVGGEGGGVEGGALVMTVITCHMRYRMTVCG